MTIFQQAKDNKFSNALRAAVAERGEGFVYPYGTEGWSPKDPYVDGEAFTSDCLYVRTDVDEPACLIGLALHKTGMSLDDLRKHESKSSWAFMGELGYSIDIVNAASDAQQAQDKGKPWGAALDAFEVRVG
jgi:hypothetical protein